MSAVVAKVQQGRIQVDEFTDLPDGTMVQLYIVDQGDALEEEERQALDDALEDAARSVARGGDDRRRGCAAPARCRRLKVTILFSPQALVQVQAAHAWWKENRPSAPRLFRDELAEALRLLRTAPRAGAPYPHRRLRDVRRIVLQSSRYYIMSPTQVA